MARPQKNKQVQENSLEDILTSKPISTPPIITRSDDGHVMIMTPDEYRDWSLSQGRIMGRRPDQVTFPTEEEMRILINTGYTRAMIKEKHGVNDEQIDQLLKNMSFKERRDKVVVLH